MRIATDGAARPVKAVILDLDGLILDTETLCVEVAREVVARHGKQLTLEAQRVALGKRPLECWSDVAKVLGLDVPAEQLLAESEPLLAARWADAPVLPGALRLVRHLAAVGLPYAVATSTPRRTFVSKMSRKDELRGLLAERPGAVVVCGDEVAAGKPRPDVFLEAAARLCVCPEECLVLEDAPSGVEGATAAGMRVVVVPSLVASTSASSSGGGGGGEGGGDSDPKASASPYPAPDPTASSGVVQSLPSLLALDPTSFALPPFTDLLPPGAPGNPGGGVIPMDTVIRIRGRVVKGFGRGSKELGIPTANIDPEALAGALSEAVTGIYAGWAALGPAKGAGDCGGGGGGCSSSGGVFKTVMSIGWNPFFGNKEKTLEPWILHSFDKPFYGETLSLVICGYVRPEANFTSLQALVERIHLDGQVASEALDCNPLAALAGDSFLVMRD